MNRSAATLKGEHLVSFRFSAQERADTGCPFARGFGDTRWRAPIENAGSFTGPSSVRLISPRVIIDQRDARGPLHRLLHKDKVLQ